MFRNSFLALLIIGASVGEVCPAPSRVVLQDNLTSTGFTVTYSNTTNVSGGGGALQTAVNGAGSSTRLLITDSLTYDPVQVSGCTDLTIEADSGQQPVIKRASPPHNTSGWVMRLSGTIDGFAVRGLTFMGNGNRNQLSFYDDGLFSVRWDTCTSGDRIIVENCSFAEDGTDNANSGPGVFIGGTSGVNHLRVWVNACTFTNNANGSAATPNGYGACTVVGYDEVWIQNCSVTRTDAVVARGSSHMRGFAVNNNSTVIEDCLAYDLGTAGSNEAFKHVASFGSESTNGPVTIRNCVAYRAKRGYREDHPNQSMTITNSVYHTDLTGILDKVFRLDNSGTSMTVTDCVAVGAGDGTCFSSTSITESFNDIYNFGTVGKTLAASDLTVDPAFTDVGSRNWIATTASVQTGASDGGAMGVRYPGGTTIIWAGH